MKSKILTVFHIEDDDDHAELLAAAVDNSNVIDRIIRFNDAESCLSYLFGKTADSTSRFPIIILLDMTLPGMSGMEFLQWIRADESTRGIPVIVFAASDNEKQIAEAYRYGANSYVIKPTEFEDFIVKLAELNMYWNLTAEIPKTGFLSPLGIKSDS